MWVAVLILALAAPPEHKRAPEPSAAEQLAARGVAAYRAREFDKAGRYFFRAYELSREPTQLRNAAKAYDAAGEVALAREYWQRLVELPALSEADRAEARAQLTALTPPVVAPPIVTPPPQQQQREEEEVAEAAVTVERPPIVQPSKAPWIIGGAGIAAFVAGTFLYAESSSQRSELQRRLDDKEGGLTAGISYDESLDARARVVNLRIASGLALTAGVAAIATGAVWLATADDGAETLAIAPIPGGAIATYGASW